MTFEHLVELCLNYEGVYLDYPFNDQTAVARHAGGGRLYALIIRREGRLTVNLKSHPLEADFLKRVFRGVMPGYHMNKTHWITVDVNSDVGEDELIKMVTASFLLTSGKKKRQAGL